METEVLVMYVTVSRQRCATTIPILMRPLTTTIITTPTNSRQKETGVMNRRAVCERKKYDEQHYFNWDFNTGIGLCVCATHTYKSASVGGGGVDRTSRERERDTFVKMTTGRQSVCIVMHVYLYTFSLWPACIYCMFYLFFLFFLFRCCSLALLLLWSSSLLLFFFHFLVHNVGSVSCVLT